MKALFIKEPRLALYSPFNMLAFKKTGENRTQLMHLTPEAILDIAGITDERICSKFKSNGRQKNNQLTITNPLYLQSAFLQEGYNKNAAQK